MSGSMSEVVWDRLDDDLIHDGDGGFVVHCECDEAIVKVWPDGKDEKCWYCGRVYRALVAIEKRNAR